MSGKLTNGSRFYSPATLRLEPGVPQTGPQREIFPESTKIDAGPQKLGEEQKVPEKKGLHSNLVPFLAQNQVKSKKKKGLHSNLVPFFAQH